jgi:hypothetical protein
MSQQDNIIQAKGLVTFSNELSVPRGSLVKARNININERGVITPRRGFNDYGAAFGSTDDRISQIIEYKDRIIRHYGTTLEFDDGSGTFTAFTGTYSEIEDGFRIKYQEANSNLYFTTSAGIKKISISSNSQYAAGIVEDAGAIKAYDTTESKVAYRVLFGKRDGNNNLLLGAVSARFVVTNTSAVDNANVDVEITLPSGLTTDYFYQVYRTGVVQISGALTLNDIDPGDEMNLVIENPITSADLSAGTITVSDITPESFREAGAFLYTNEITGEGILQNNEPPPIAKDVELFRNSNFYANTKTVHTLSVDMISISNLTAGTTEFIVGNSTNTRQYLFDNVEDVGNQVAEISASGSVGQAIDETARSLVKVINRDPSGIVYARYLSGANDLPGKIQLESRTLVDDNFYIATNDSSAASDFNPILPVTSAIVDVTFSAGSGSPANIQSTGHGLSTGDSVFVYSPDTTPAISGQYIVTVVDVNNFTIPEDITGEDLAGTNALWFSPTSTTTSDNTEAPNRVYFSKTSQPDAVPSVNFIDVGPQDEPIERIIALRDNLFILKTDGIYIVDGVTAPNFSVRLLENSTNIIAPDSAVVLNNQIYALTSQGIATITETGVSVISRPIEDRILGITNSKFNFRLPAFGVAYESERSYHLWLPTETTDTVATQCYRYNSFERAWTRWDVSATAGLVISADDKLYIGDGTRNYIQQERKERDRTDYADRNFTRSLGANKLTGTSIELNTSVDVNIGDVIVQDQYVTISVFNRLLRKLDIDPGLDDTDYESTLEMSNGDNITSSLDALNAKLVLDDSSGTISARTFSTNSQAMQDEYNALIAELNDVSADTLYKNYRTQDDVLTYESIITAKTSGTNIVTVSHEAPFIQGDLEIYKGIEKEIQWAPDHFGNPSLLKQMREGTIIFDQNNFYSATVSYSSDLSGGFVEIPFFGKGVGYWGYGLWGNIDPTFYWGGIGNDVPFVYLSLCDQYQQGHIDNETI